MGGIHALCQAFISCVSQALVLGPSILESAGENVKGANSQDSFAWMHISAISHLPWSMPAFENFCPRPSTAAEGNTIVATHTLACWHPRV